MKIAIVGTGYVGLVTGTCFAEVGLEVTCIDVDRQKIENLSKGKIPIYEPGLDDLVLKNIQAGRLQFHTDLNACLNGMEAVFIAVGTPPGEDGSADLKYVLEVAATIGANMQQYLLIVTKSTVPVGTALKVRETVQRELDRRGVCLAFDVASNPEFLKEGAAVHDFMYPERVVLGVESEKAENILRRLYHPFLLNNFPVIFMDVASAEMTKYAANAMLATRISFMNEMANLCEIMGADINMIRKGIGTDSRIGSKFLYAGCGYGGSCFPKDVKALIKTARDNGYTMHVIEAAEKVNERQKSILFRKLYDYYRGDLKGRTVALWGLSFKPETDDMREAPSLTLVEQLTAAGVNIRAYDPVAMKEAGKRISAPVVYCKDKYEAAIDADAIMLVTEWTDFRMPSWPVIKKTLKHPLIIDGRNIYDKNELSENGLTCLGIGRK
ncbi:MAG: UDP-glucose/GDP-mannose dehydrogenase family protein [Bacteroidales bacterium]|jgi:UDPglucose 6-dehydrogenase|nr:UDP-glucose/GDP-mannose dehydrogenase family protein [Bacteroidales bacterium]